MLKYLRCWNILLWNMNHIHQFNTCEPFCHCWHNLPWYNTFFLLALESCSKAYLVSRIGLICCHLKNTGNGTMIRQLIAELFPHVQGQPHSMTVASFLPKLTLKRRIGTIRCLFSFPLHQISVATFTHGRGAVNSIHPSNIYSMPAMC